MNVETKFVERRLRNLNKPRIDNAQLYAGEPMYYYCAACNDLMMMPEDHNCVAPNYCNACVEEGLGQNHLSYVLWMPEP